VAGEPDTFMRPQSAIVETSDFGQGVEAAAMGVAGEILKLLQFTKDSEIGVCAEDAFRRVSTSLRPVFMEFSEFFHLC